MGKFLRFFGINLFVVSLVFAGEPLPLDLGSLKAEFRNENRFFQGLWSGQENWEGTFCESVYKYDAVLQAELDDLDMDLDENGSLLLNLTLKGLYGKFSGKYKSGYSLCVPLEGWLGAGSEWVKIQARVDFKDMGEGKVSHEVTITGSEFGRIDVGSVPAWVEDKLTGWLNKATRGLWKTRIGTWINKKVSKVINDAAEGRNQR